MDVKMWKLAVLAALVMMFLAFEPLATYAYNEDPGGKAVYAKRGVPDPNYVTIGWDMNGDGKADTETVWQMGWFQG